MENAAGSAEYPAFVSLWIRRARRFRRFDHQPPFRYLMRLKMNWAVERLRAPAAPVKEITLQIGIGAPFHFFSRIHEHFRPVAQCISATVMMRLVMTDNAACGY